MAAGEAGLAVLDHGELRLERYGSLEELAVRYPDFDAFLIDMAVGLVSDRIILCGSLFRGENIREELIRACQVFDPSYGRERIVYTGLSEKEGYIGPYAVYAERMLNGEAGR